MTKEELVDRYNFLQLSEQDKEKQLLRKQREIECFLIINRGKLWYDTLTTTQIEELNIWYQSWLDITETLSFPEKPTWIQ